MMRFGSYRMITVISLMSVAVIILFYLLTSVAWEKYQDYGRQADDLEPRISRLLGVQQSHDLLLKANETVNSQLIDLTYPAVTDTAITGASMQKKVRETIELAGMEINGSQILPAKIGNGFDKILLNITATGSVESLQEVLISLREMHPKVIVEAVNIKPVRIRRRGEATQKISVRFKLLSLRLQS